MLNDGRKFPESLTESHDRIYINRPDRQYVEEDEAVGYVFESVFLLFLYGCFLMYYGYFCDNGKWLYFMGSTIEETLAFLDTFVSAKITHLSWYEFFFSWFTMFSSAVNYSFYSDNFFYVSAGNDYPYYEVDDWWQNSPVLDANNFSFYAHEEHLKQEEPEDVSYSDFYGSVPSESENLQNVAFKGRKGSKFFKKLYPLYFNTPWRSHWTIVSGHPAIEKAIPVLNLYSQKLFRRKEAGHFDVATYTEMLDIDWVYLHRILQISDWNYQSVSPLNNFWSFTYDHFW
jgi:hypothetical protein